MGLNKVYNYSVVCLSVGLQRFLRKKRCELLANLPVLVQFMSATVVEFCWLQPSVSRHREQSFLSFADVQALVPHNYIPLENSCRLVCPDFLIKEECL